MKRIKTLKQFPEYAGKCPFCKTNKSAKTLLIPVIEKDFRKDIHRVIAVHRHCILERILFSQETGTFFALPKATK